MAAAAKILVSADGRDNLGPLGSLRRAVPMRSSKRVLGLALIAAGFSCGAQAAPANVTCREFSRTFPGGDLVTAVAGAEGALSDAIKQFRIENKVGPITVTAMRAKPEPYWRDAVSEDLFYKPDIVKAKSYTVCWRGVIAPAVCTSGAKACWPER